MKRDKTTTHHPLLSAQEGFFYLEFILWSFALLTLIQTTMTAHQQIDDLTKKELQLFSKKWKQIKK